MKIEITTPKINENEIVKQEIYFKCEFPEDYKKFLLEYNGGIPEKTLIYFSNDGGIIDLFFGFCDDDIYGLRKNNASYLNRKPSNMMPIACDPGGNLFLMSIRGNDYGSIYFWDHEFEVEDDQEADYSNLTFVAKSFTDLINNLRDISELDSK